MLKKLKSFLNRWLLYKRRASIHSDLDILLAAAKENRKLEDILQWLVKLVRWIRHDGSLELQSEIGSERVPLARLKYLFMVLDRNPEWKKDVAFKLRTVVRKVNGLELYTETGLPKGSKLWSELIDRLIMKILPTPALDQELSYLFWELFPDREDPIWLASIDAATFGKILELFYYDVAADEQGWNRLKFDLEDALDYLVIQVRAIGLSPEIRHRLDKNNFRDSAFFDLLQGYENFIQSSQSQDRDKVSEMVINFRMIILKCRQELVEVHDHLNQYGVSVDLVFQMARVNIYLSRIDNFLDILLSEKINHEKVMGFFSRLVAENQELRSIGSLFSQNLSLLARKVAERAAETGEHYITRTKEEYSHMLQSAAGGGAIMAITVYIKFGIVSLGLSGFMEGFFASVNYAASFILIHVVGFTIGTKQPSVTAPALAAKMQNIETEQGIQELVTEISHLVRSQVASVLGNIMLVVPMVILIDVIFWMLFGQHLLSVDKAHYNYKAADIFGPSVLYAAFTGVLLWLSSLIAGWGDNWFALNSLRKRLARSSGLRAIFGRRGAAGISSYLENNISGLLGNISLGFFLGMAPVIMKFIGIPLDIRHVTISSGNLASAVSVLGTDFMGTWDFWRAFLGVISIGIINVTVSFGLALLVAIKARSINPPQRRAIRKAVQKRFISNPLSFLLPVKLQNQ